MNQSEKFRYWQLGKKKQPIVGIYNLFTKPVELFTLLAQDNNYNLQS